MPSAQPPRCSLSISSSPQSAACAALAYLLLVLRRPVAAPAAPAAVPCWPACPACSRLGWMCAATRPGACSSPSVWRLSVCLRLDCRQCCSHISSTRAVHPTTFAPSAGRQAAWQTVMLPSAWFATSQSMSWYFGVAGEAAWIPGGSISLVAPAVPSGGVTLTVSHTSLHDGQQGQFEVMMSCAACCVRHRLRQTLRWT